MWSIKRLKYALFVAIGLLTILVTGCTIVLKKTYYKVEFYVQDELISTQSVLMNRAAIAPKDPEIEGYVFMGWDQRFDHVTKDMKIKAILVEKQLEDLEKLNEDLNALKRYLKNHPLNELNILPIQGEKHQSKIEWISPNDGVNIDELGNIKIIEGIQNISLHVILSLNDSVIYYEFVL